MDGWMDEWMNGWINIASRTNSWIALAVGSVGTYLPRLSYLVPTIYMYLGRLYIATFVGHDKSGLAQSPLRLRLALSSRAHILQ